MRKLIFIIVLFFSTSVLAVGSWKITPNKLKDVINLGYKIVSVTTEGNYNYYTLLLEGSANPIVICSVNLVKGKPEFSVCYYEE